MSKDLITTTANRSNQPNYKNSDPICSLAISEKLLLVARESGVINEYSIQNVALRNRYKSGSKPYKMSINCNST